MIKFYEMSNDDPYIVFKKYYDKALLKNQQNIEAIAISSVDIEKKQVNSRFVNLKYIQKDNWVFFSNYDSPKAQEFEMNNKIHALFFWQELNLQIRIKAKIKKLSNELSDEHFKKRKFEKNIVALVSKQSKKISSYEAMENKFNNFFKTKSALTERPDYWGGFTFNPFYFEFWFGDENRINKRCVYEKNKDKWNSFFIQP